MEGDPATSSPTEHQAARPTTGQSDENWRYRWSENHWWYWSPDNRWYYQDNERWVPYSPDSWRYRWDNGHWWYWGADNRWMWYGNDGRWLNYGTTYAVQRPIVENFSGGPIKIVNPARNGVTLSYLLNGATYTIPPGYSQELREEPTGHGEYRWSDPALGGRRR